MRILMMGTGPFAVPTFRGLLDSSHEVLGLVTRPVPPAVGRKRQQTSTNPMRELAEREGIVVTAPESIRSPSAVESLRQFNADLHVVCDYGQILSNDGLATARLGGINLHGSLLPKYRGAAPINWAIWHGEKTTGVTVIHMTAGLDAGPCLVQHDTPIGPDEDAVELEGRLSLMGWPAVEQAITMLETWDGSSPIGHVQDPTLATRAPRLTKSDGLIDWTRSATQIHDQVLAFKPWPGSYTQWSRPKGDLRLVVTRTQVEASGDAGGQPGQILEATEDRLVVACGQGNLKLVEVQPAGKKCLAADAFLRGYPLQPGDRLGASSG